MPCALADDSSWPAFLAARTLLANGSRDLFFVKNGDRWSCSNEAPSRADQVLCAVRVGAAPWRGEAERRSEYHPAADGRAEFSHPTDRPVDATMLAMARVYLPILLLAARAHDEQRVFVVAHVTQTLDGRIACDNGQSQWIGNDADLRHAHRMRALVDAVAVGANTVVTDDPRLTVRLVAGEHPRRIVLSARGSVLRDERPLHVFTQPGCTIVVGDGVATDGAPATARLVRVTQLPDASLDPRAVLTALHATGIRSLYLEGGANVLSSFLHANCIDVLQVHIASMLLGSGLPSFRLPPVDHVRHGLTFAVDHMMLDGHVLLSCWPAARPRQP